MYFHPLGFSFFMIGFVLLFKITGKIQEGFCYVFKKGHKDHCSIFISTFN